jgi:hypothetical protein
MPGYWNQPAATAHAIRDGWLYTGDIGALDAQGFLTLMDRSKDLVISGGNNIYPREVEETLLTHPQVQEVSVIGRPDAEWGESLVAYVVARGPVSAQDLDRHCLAQLARYTDDLAWLRSAGLGAVERHTANSFATLQHPATRLDMVRVGGLLYGDPGSVKTDRFVPTMAIKSRVAAVNHYPAGQTVNYDRTWRLERESWLANIPLGYSDGVRRSLSRSNRPEFPAETRNRTEVLIGGRRFPVVGRVTMNTLMVDVTDARDTVRLGDEVVLFGAQGRERITQAELEANSQAYGPELLGVLGAGLPRVLKPSAGEGAG